MRPACGRGPGTTCSSAFRDTLIKLIEDAGFAAVDLGPTANARTMEAARRPGSVYGEEYELPEARAAAEAVLQGRAIPPTPHY